LTSPFRRAYRCIVAAAVSQTPKGSFQIGGTLPVGRLGLGALAWPLGTPPAALPIPRFGSAS
jgi:hypothetical protein